MNIAALRVRVTLQKNETVTDQYGNHCSAWTDRFSCWATAITGGGGETSAAAHTEEGDRLDLTVRWSTETAAVNSKEYRVLLNGRVYNITGIDEMGFRKNSRKLHCELSER